MLTDLHEKTDNLHQTVNKNMLLKQYSIQQLLDQTLDNEMNQGTESSFKTELIERGKNDIYARIEIKKACKVVISNHEVLIREFEEKKLTDKKLASTLKKKFLTAISILDKLQLEWQKYDLRLKR